MTDIEIKTLILLGLMDGCPFCFADLKRKSPIERGFERGMRGDDLRIFIENQKAALLAESIDVETMHKTWCERPASLRGID
jgi:hypothetical protein